MRKQREFDKVIGKFTFVCRRPTAKEADEMTIGTTMRTIMCSIAQRFVVDWKDVTEDDVAGGAGTDLLPFNAALWQEWCADRKDFWGPCPKHLETFPPPDDCPKCNPLPSAILGAYKKHRDALETAAKNSQPGSSNAM